MALLDIEGKSVEQGFDPGDLLRAGIRRACGSRTLVLLGDLVAEGFVRLGFDGDHYGTVVVLDDEEEIDVRLFTAELVDRDAGFGLGAPLAQKPNAATGGEDLYDVRL